MSGLRLVERRVKVDVDLTGSTLGPDWLSVELVIAPGDHDDAWVREGAARHYGVPLEQVGEVAAVPFDYEPEVEEPS